MGKIEYMNKQSIELLQLKIKNLRMPQREIAKQLGLSLGETNKLLEQLKESLIVDQKFRLTNKGKEYISQHKLKENH